MRVSCSVPIEHCPWSLAHDVGQLSIAPIITPQVFRAVYEGEEKTGNALIKLFSVIPGNQITVDRDQVKERKPREERPRPTPKRKRHRKDR